MPTLLRLFKHVKEQDNHPFMLDTIRAVIRSRLAMPHAAVWWVFESVRLDTHKTIAEAIEAIKTEGVKVHEVPSFGGFEKVAGYSLWYREDGAYPTDDPYWDIIVFDSYEAERLTEAYIKEAQFK
ncbi:MAG: hypothetical protein A2854_04270 [Parcubacteria group bacterium RIFCSPHIGHO2_01_FULL_56_18]|nr:MAG: hypothetical protein A2854_04270 [Parcubacteria group bacterium RIFCSPHIGHO2_01_FULL_56_18]